MENRRATQVGEQVTDVLTREMRDQGYERPYAPKLARDGKAGDL